MSYLRGDALLTECRAGQGVIAIVEGETQQDDPYFYGRWFGDRAREISFFAQNGWRNVVAAVRDLRQQVPYRVVVGIVDRDYAQEAVLAQQQTGVPADYVFRSRRFTLENHLLEPEGWYGVIEMLHRGPLPPGWQDAAAVARRIEESYQRCLSLAAYNWVLHEENCRVPQHGRPYLDHPDQVGGSAADDLSRWGRDRSCPIDLGQLFRKRLTWLETLAPQDWPCWVSGKHVLRRLLLPSLPRPQKIPNDYLLNAYVRVYPHPPSDLQDIIQRILQLAASGP